jgi:hypothetical protein
VVANLTLRFGDEKSLMNRAMAGQLVLAINAAMVEHISLDKISFVKAGDFAKAAAAN